MKHRTNFELKILIYKYIAFFIELPLKLASVFANVLIKSLFSFLKDYFIPVLAMIIILLLFCANNMGSLFSSPPKYEYSARVVESVVLKNEYLVHLSRLYVEKGGQLPAKEKRVLEVFKEFREYCEIEEDYLDYLRWIAINVPKQEPLYSVMADFVYLGSGGLEVIRTDKADIGIAGLNKKTENSFFSEDARFWEYCFFERRKTAEGIDILYIGYRCNKFLLKTGNQAFFQVIIAAMDNEYFQNLKESPYKKGPIIIRKIILSPKSALNRRAVCYEKEFA